MGHPRALAALTRPITRQAGGKAGATALGRLALDWALIVGPHWAAATRPEKLLPGRGEEGGATLTLAVDPGEALALQHELPRLIERINGHYGHRAVARVKLHQLPAAEPVRRSVARRASPSDEAAVDGLVAAVADDALRQRLARIGKTLYALEPAANSD
jgi:hypothetical protein